MGLINWLTCGHRGNRIAFQETRASCRESWASCTDAAEHQRINTTLCPGDRTAKTTWVVRPGVLSFTLFLIFSSCSFLHLLSCPKCAFHCVCVCVCEKSPCLQRATTRHERRYQTWWAERHRRQCSATPPLWKQNGRRQSERWKAARRHRQLYSNSYFIKLQESTKHRKVLKDWIKHKYAQKINGTCSNFYLFINE